MQAFLSSEFTRQIRTDLDLKQLNRTRLSYSSINFIGDKLMPHDRYQTVQELAERLEVAEATVRQWIKIGLLRAIDIGKGWRIADTDLELFLRARESGAAQRRRPGSQRPHEQRCDPR